LPPVPPDLAARGIALRPRRDDDANFVRDVYVAARWDEVKITGWPEPVRLAFLHDQHRLQDTHYRLYYQGAAWGIVEAGGERAGRLYLMRSGSDLRLIDIALMPACRGKGIGGGLIGAVQDQARTLGLATVSIHVEQFNPARTLYERLGFHQTGTTGIYHLMKWPVP
jgi:GNAT superfamily N-acetyltransferase